MLNSLIEKKIRDEIKNLKFGVSLANQRIFKAEKRIKKLEKKIEKTKQSLSFDNMYQRHLLDKIDELWKMLGDTETIV